MRSRGPALELIGWAIVAFVGTLVVCQAAGWTGLRSVAIVQSLTPYFGLLMLPVALASLWAHRWYLVLTSVTIGFGVLVLAAPIAFPDAQNEPIADAVGLRVASINLLYRNQRIDEVAATLKGLGADVIVFSEFTEEHQLALQNSPLAAQFEYRINRSGLFAGSVAIWSRTPVTVAASPDTSNYSLDVTVVGTDGPVRIVGMHMPTPIISFQNWQRDLHTAAEIGRTASGPTMVVGDLNSSYWHPDFREVLDAGLTDAHTANGRGFSTSWPTDRPVPAFVRLDHALVTDDLVATDVEDFEIPGSDHRGFVVTVAPAR